jgi:hypothetical protein
MAYFAGPAAAIKVRTVRDKAAGRSPRRAVCCAPVNTPKEALIISAAGLATTASTGFIILRALRARRWLLTSGTVLESDIAHIEDNSGEPSKLRYRLRVRYSYTVAGQEFTGDRLSFFGADARHSTRTLAAAHRNRIIRSDKIDLWYNPADPSQAVNDRKIPWAFWFAFAIGVIFLLGGALPLLLGRVRG